MEIREESKSNVTNDSIGSMATICMQTCCTLWTVLVSLIIVIVILKKQNKKKWENLTVWVSFSVLAMVHIETFVTWILPLL